MSIVIEHSDPEYAWEMPDEVYANLLENSHLRRRIYQLARTLYRSTNDLVLVDHELFISPLYVVRLSTEKHFTGMLRKRLWRIMMDEERERVLAEADN